jgi:hypothetical protein
METMFGIVSKNTSLNTESSTKYLNLSLLIIYTSLDKNLSFYDCLFADY